MTLVKFKNPAFDRLTQMPTVFTDFFSDFLNEDLLPKGYFKSVPAVNIQETENDYQIELAAPGMKKEDFKVEVENGIMTIKAEMKEQKTTENGKYTRKEFNYNSFTRSFTLPEMINFDSIKAEYTDGILKLMIPKKEEAKKHLIKEIKIS